MQLKLVDNESSINFNLTSKGYKRGQRGSETQTDFQTSTSYIFEKPVNISEEDQVDLVPQGVQSAI